MCTAISFLSKDHYFGRNLDLEYDYQSEITITPRNFPLKFRYMHPVTEHLALIGMAVVSDGYPLYFDATNEVGLSMAGLNFPQNSVYRNISQEADNIAPFEFIPWILSQCKNVSEAKALLTKINLIDVPFSSQYPQSPLHWFLSDRNQSITVEAVSDGLQIYDNPVGVLTNNPPFPYHLYRLTEYMNVTCEEPTNKFAPQILIEPYSRGMGSIGLPGDLSSSSRFIKAAFTKLNSQCGTSESESISQFFHILGSVTQQNGCVKIGNHFEKTIYSSCCNTTKGIYYYTTYENSQITGVSLRNADLDSSRLACFPLITGQQINMQN